LVSDAVLQKAIEDGTKTKDYFGIAYGFEDGKYIDFRFGDADKYYIISSSALIINPAKAEEYSKTLVRNEPASPEGKVEQGSDNGNANTGVSSPKTESTDTGAVSTRSEITTYKRFFGSVTLSPNSAVNDFMDINEDVIRKLTDSGAEVEITVEIQAKHKDGFDSRTVRTVIENCPHRNFNMDNTNFTEE
ncbi:MAG: hypothetical protein J6X83_00275, partial [Methanomicrobium sp.]|nr:hypothetical protein [Methanomicrobium sp.]